jgi:hypothetical protein
MGVIDYSDAYRTFHRENPKFFPGYSVCGYAPAIAELVVKTHAKRLLDYGCGKGYQYLVRRVHEQWGGILPHCYDVGVPQLAKRPEGVFDGVICTDVLEHIAEADVDDILADIFDFAAADTPSFVFLVIACRPAKKSFADGTNVHLTVKPPEWWTQRIGQFRRDGVALRVEFDQG